MANYNLGEARGKIVLETDFSSLKEGQSVLDGAKKSAEDAAQTQQQAWGKVGTAATVGGAAVVAGFVAAVGAASSFEFKMSAIQAVSGATAGEMDLIREAALRIGKDTSFSASEAALAMEELLKAGVSTEDVLNGAADATVALAAAGQIELPEAATIASNALNQFKLGAEDLTEVADIMAGAANASATGVSEIGMALSFVGPTANAAGVSIGDAAQMISLFANNGIDGARAGTALRGLISNLASPTAQASKALEELGLITEEGGNQFFDASGKMKSMEEVTTLLRDAMGGMTSEQLLANGEILVGRENLSALAAIVNTSAEEYRGLGDAINNTSAADVSATRLGNMQGSMEALMGSIETLGITVGSRLIPAITSMVDKLTSAFDWFLSLDEGVQKTIVTVAGITGGLLLLGGAVIKTIQGVRSAVSVIKALSLTANPIGLVVAAIAALVAALIWFFTKTELGRQIWSDFMSFLQSAWTNTSNFLTTLWEGLVTAVTDAWTSISTFFTTLWEGLSAVVTSVWGGIMAAINAVVVWFQTYVLPIIQLVIDAIVAYFTFFYDTAMAIWNAVQAAVGVVVDWFMAHVYPTIKAVVDFLVALFEYLWKWVEFIWDGIVTTISTVVDAIVSWLTEQWNNFLRGWQVIWDAISKVVTTIWNAIVNFVKPIVDGIVNWITNAWESFLRGWQSLWDRVNQVITIIWNAIKSFVEPIVRGIVDFITNTWSGIVDTVSTIFNNVKDSIVTSLQTALDFIGGIKDKIMGFFQGAGDWLFNIGKDIIDGLIRGLEAMFGKVGSFFRNLTDMIPETKGPPAKDRVLLTENGKLIMQSLYNGLASEMGNVEDLLNGMNATIPATLQQDIAANVQSNQRPQVILNLEYHAAAGDGTKTKEDVMAMLGHATELVREEMS